MNPFEDHPEVPDLNGDVVIWSTRPVHSSSYSLIYRGNLRSNGQSVAVKVFVAIKGTTVHTMRRKILRERRTWGVLKHPNILPLYGFVNEEVLFQPFGALVSPWLDRGDASDFLLAGGSTLNHDQRLDLWKEVIAGVSYLHSHDPCLVHGDLKPSNILINDSGHAQICDFGLVRILYNEEYSIMTTTTQHTGTERYLAYELVIAGEKAKPTTYSDIYAVGCIGLEFLFSQIPHATHKSGYGGTICNDIKAGVPPAVAPANSQPHIRSDWTKLEWCWTKNPTERPPAELLHSWLEGRNSKPTSNVGSARIPEPVSKAESIPTPKQMLSVDSTLISRSTSNLDSTLVPKPTPIVDFTAIPSKPTPSRHVTANHSSEEIYQGPEAIVVAMDIGTTQSAVSFAYFSPGTIPQAKMVALWPKSTWREADKTPSIVSYKNGIVKACGAEAVQDFEENQKNVAYWFKLYLHPALTIQSNIPEFEIPSLPAGVNIEQVYTDMMKYLMQHTQGFFERTTTNGVEIWKRVRDTIIIVLATPNGWDIREQAILRKAATGASLVTKENAGQLLQFVTESEASVHYVLANNPVEWLKRRGIFAVIDCGGSTVDTAVYRCASIDPLRLEETCPSECLQTGGIFVNREVEKILKKKLKRSSLNDSEIIKRMMYAFESQLKPDFDGIQRQYNLKFGNIKDNDPSAGINRGSIILYHEDLKPAFDAATDKIRHICSKILPRQKVEYVVLVGGFGDSPYVQKVLSETLRSHKIHLVTVSDHGRKAAAYVTHLVTLINGNDSETSLFASEGAMLWNIKQFVVARVARATFGGCVRPLYEKKLHRERSHLIQIYPDGKRRVDGAFHMWIKKGTALQGTFAHKLRYHVAWDATSMSKDELARRLGTVEIEVFAWESNGIPTWCKDEHGAVLDGMRPICTLSANLSALAGGLQITNGPRRRKYYRVDYNVCVYFGGTQLHAKLQWYQGSMLHESEVKVMPYVS